MNESREQYWAQEEVKLQCGPDKALANPTGSSGANIAC